MLAGFKFAVKSGLGPVYRRPRFDYRDGLLSGPAWAGLLAVLMTRRDALRTWLSGGAARNVVMGALAAALSAQAGATPSVGQGELKGHGSLSHPIAALQAAGGSGPTVAASQPSESAGTLKVSESDGDPAAVAANLPAAAQPSPFIVSGGQGWRGPVAGSGDARMIGERFDVLNDINVFDLSGIAGPNPGSGRTGNDAPGSQSGDAGQALDNSALGSSASASGSSASAWGSSGSPADEALPGAGGVFGRHSGASVMVFAGYDGSRRGDAVGRSATGMAKRSALVLAALGGQAQGDDGSTVLAAPSLSGGLPGSLGAPRAGAVPEPASWVIMVLGLALAGGAARRQRALA